MTARDVARLDLGRGAPRRRRPDLTPMIDIVFILLIFFMLVTRVTAERALPIALDAASFGGGSVAEGPPRFVTVTRDGWRLNGAPIAPEALGPALDRLAPDREAPVLVRGADGADLQALVAVIERLDAAGRRRVALVE